MRQRHDRAVEHATEVKSAECGGEESSGDETEHDRDAPERAGEHPGEQHGQSDDGERQIDVHRVGKALAAGLVRAARELGRAIPADLRIATRYDGLRAKLSEPPLTALDLHLPEVAETAVDLLLTRVSGEVGHAVAPFPGLVLRASTGRV